MAGGIRATERVLSMDIRTVLRMLKKANGLLQVSANSHQSHVDSTIQSLSIIKNNTKESLFRLKIWVCLIHNRGAVS